MGGMLSIVQDDRVGLAYNVASFVFLNMSIDITSIDWVGRSYPVLA